MELNYQSRRRTRWMSYLKRRERMEEEGREEVVAGWERKGMVRKGEYRDGGWWLGDDGFVDGGLEMMGLGWWVWDGGL